ncbi:MAG TPA: glycoside hydrolase family 28 protein [Bacteroidota bacterium]|nr:glycoside hydrolase family 28 protein [Bacteroidota bacterium]
MIRQITRSASGHALTLILVTMLCALSTHAQTRGAIEPVPAAYLQNLPFAMPEIRLPEFPDRTMSLREFGAVADGRTMNTEAFSRAIKALSAAGGGTLIVPPGEYLTGPIVLESNINLHVERGALVVFSKRFEDFPLMPFPTPKSKNFKCAPPIFGYKLENVAITGGGVFDGSGEAWRPAKKEKYTANEWKSLTGSGGVVSDDGKMWYPSKEAMNGEAYLAELKKTTSNPTAEQTAGAREFLRPKMVELYGCTRVLLDGPTFRNSPQFAVHPAECEHLVVRNVTIQNPYSAQNGDGLDLSSCHTAIVYKTVVDAGDDALCIKPGGVSSSKKWDVSCENIIITDCTVYHGHGGFVIGSETYGGARNILARNLTFLGTDVGLRFKSARDRGGVIEKIFIDGIVMKDIVNEAVLFETYYASGSPEKNALSRDDSRKAEAVNERTPTFKEFSIRNLTCLGADRAILFLGLPEMPIKDISITDAVITSRKGALIVDADGVTLERVKIIPSSGPVYTVNEAKRVSITQGIVPEGTQTFLNVAGAGSSAIVISQTDVSKAKLPVELGAGASQTAVDVRR